MSHDRERETPSPAEAGAASSATHSPGRSTPTARLPAQVHRGDPVQAKGALDGPDVHAAAAHGLTGSAAALPFLDQIQRAFGHHDVGGVRAHIGGPAAEASAAMNARAYASGDSVAFAGSPDLHTAAHEAAHVVQQRGGVRLAGGVGQAGDAYERHADDVADAVVRGDSAEALLDPYAHRGAAGGPAVQRIDSHDVVGNTMSATSDRLGGTIDARSERRVYERLAELKGRDPAAAGREFEAMTPEDRSRALREAITEFQSEHGEEIEQIVEDNDVRRGDGTPMYDAPATGRLSTENAPRADATIGEARPNDATMQALANAWPQTILGRRMTEDQAYRVLRALVTGRGLPWADDRINVVGMRAYQGGAIHDNNEDRMFTRNNRYDDTLFTVTQDHHVQVTRGTVDPGGSERSTHPHFQVAADQQWEYQGNARGTSRKFDRPLYGLADGEQDARRGTYWQQHPDEVAAARENTRHGAHRGGSGRLVHRPDGTTELDHNYRGDRRMVSAVHSGGRGGRSGEQVFADSIGCSVVPGAWFPHFNESLRRAAGGDRVEFTYSLIDPRTYAPGELEALLDAQGVPRNPNRPSPSTADTAPVHPDGDIDRGLDPATVQRAAAEGVGGPPSALPYLDQIQRSFGRHDVTGVRAHVGGAASQAAAAIGARAYATGNDVAFSGPPDLRQAAHEAAHTVQQRGGVQLDGGVGHAGDPYERHADAVADLVVRGQSAEHLLDEHARGSAAAGGAAVQRIDFNRDGRDDGATRRPEVLSQLMEDTIAAIARNETGGAEESTESAMHTSAGVPASYASATQMTAPHAAQVMLGPGRGEAPEDREARTATLAAHGVTSGEVRDARHTMHVAQRIWDHIVVDGGSPDEISANDRRDTGFTDEELQRMVRMHRLYVRVKRTESRFGTVYAAARAWLEARATEALAQLAELHPGHQQEARATDGPGDQAATDEPAADPAATEPSDAVANEADATDSDAGGEADPTLGRRAVEAITVSRARNWAAPLTRPWTPPRHLTRAAINRRRSAVTAARGNIDRIAKAAGDAQITHELFGNPEFAELARSIDIRPADVRVYINGGQFNKFREDRNGWVRLALQHTRETHVEEGEASRSADEALSSVASADHGWGLSRIEYRSWIRAYVAANPTHTDEQVVRAAAAHNSRDRGYGDKIWRNYQQIVAARGSAADSDAADAGQAAPAPDGPGAGNR